MSNLYEQVSGAILDVFLGGVLAGVMGEEVAAAEEVVSGADGSVMAAAVVVARVDLRLRFCVPDRLSE